jgi:hypothetical protein
MGLVIVIVKVFWPPSRVIVGHVKYPVYGDMTRYDGLVCLQIMQPHIHIQVAIIGLVDGDASHCEVSSSLHVINIC